MSKAQTYAEKLAETLLRLDRQGTLTPRECSVVAQHEELHERHRRHRLFNMAADYVVEEMLRDAGVSSLTKEE